MPDILLLIIALIFNIMRKTSFSFLLVFAMGMILISGCEKDEDVPQNKLLGTWEYMETYMEVDEDTGMSYEISFELTYTFNSDLSGVANGVITYPGEEPEIENLNFSYTTEGDKLTLAIGGETLNATYTVSGNKLTIDDGEEVIIFTKK